MNNQNIFAVVSVVAMITVVISWQFYAMLTDKPDAKISRETEMILQLLQNKSVGDSFGRLMDDNEQDFVLKSHPLNAVKEVHNFNEANVLQNFMKKSFKDISRNLTDSAFHLDDIRNGRVIQVKNATEFNLPGNKEEKITVELLNQLNLSSLINFQEKPYRAHWVHVQGSFLYRINIYNQAIDELRSRIRDERKYKSWSDPSSSPVVLWGNREDYFQQLANFTSIETVALSWSRHNSLGETNLLIQKYYKWIASEPLCEWIKTPGATKARWDAVYNRTCTSDLREGIMEISLEPLYLYAKPINPNHYWPNNGDSYPSLYYTTAPSHVLYMHIAQDAVISNNGEVYSGNVKIVPYTCSHDISTNKPSGYENSPIYSEVFIMSGHWGTAHFHKSIELFPRIAPYIYFLMRNSEIMIQTSELSGRTAQVLKIFGINPDRLVSGTLRAKIAYLPQGTPCGFGQVHGLQILSKIYRDYIGTLRSNTRKQSLVMIHRSGMRRLSEALHIELRIRKLAEEFGLDFKLYHDQQLPSFDETMIMFNDAVLVVAPHGAGESNLLYCEPGTFVVEAVCNRPHVNMCYQHIAHVLGHRYHGIPSEEGCEDYIKIKPQIFEFVVKMKLLQWQSSQ